MIVIAELLLSLQYSISIFAMDFIFSADTTYLLIGVCCICTWGNFTDNAQTMKSSVSIKRPKIMIDIVSNILNKTLAQVTWNETAAFDSNLCPSE